MKYKEIFTLTRPDTSVPFHAADCIFHVDSEEDWTTSQQYTYWVNTYVNTGKCEISSPSLSEDKLSLTYSCVFLTSEYLAELAADEYFLAGYPDRLTYWEQNNITIITDVFSIE